LEANRKAYLVELGRFVVTGGFYLFLVNNGLINDENGIGLVALVAYSILSLLIFIPMRKTFAV